MDPLFDPRHVRRAFSRAAAGYDAAAALQQEVRARLLESQVARRYALQHGVPESAILIESASRTTRQNLEQARRLMQERGLRRVIVVSDPLHMARALRLSRELGIDALGSPTPSTRFRTVQTQWRFLLQEVYFFHRDLVARAA